MQVLFIDDDVTFLDTVRDCVNSYRTSRPDIRLNCLESIDAAETYISTLAMSDSTETIVFLDLTFSGSKESTYDFLARIKTNPNQAHIPVVIVTSSDDPQDIERSYAASANSYVEKGKPSRRFEIVKEVLRYWSSLASLPAAIRQV